MTIIANEQQIHHYKKIIKLQLILETKIISYYLVTIELN